MVKKAYSLETKLTYLGMKRVGKLIGHYGDLRYQRSRTVTIVGETTKKVSKLNKEIDKVGLIKLVEDYKSFYPVVVILDCFGVKRSTYYRSKKESEKLLQRGEVIEAIEQLCIENQFIYAYRTITRLFKTASRLPVNAKKIYRIMKTNHWLCRTRPKKTPNLGKPYYLTDNACIEWFHTVLKISPFISIIGEITTKIG